MVYLFLPFVMLIRQFRLDRCLLCDDDNDNGEEVKNVCSPFCVSSIVYKQKLSIYIFDKKKRKSPRILVKRHDQTVRNCRFFIYGCKGFFFYSLLLCFEYQLVSHCSGQTQKLHFRNSISECRAIFVCVCVIFQNYKSNQRRFICFSIWPLLKIY